jgi:hypothetical protein
VQFPSRSPGRGFARPRVARACRRWARGGGGGVIAMVDDCDGHFRNGLVRAACFGAGYREPAPGDREPGRRTADRAGGDCRSRHVMVRGEPERAAPGPRRILQAPVYSVSAGAVPALGPRLVGHSVVPRCIDPAAVGVLGAGVDPGSAMARQAANARRSGQGLHFAKRCLCTLCVCAARTRGRRLASPTAAGRIRHGFCRCLIHCQYCFCGNRPHDACDNSRSGAAVRIPAFRLERNCGGRSHRVRGGGHALDVLVLPAGAGDPRLRGGAFVSIRPPANLVRPSARILEGIDRYRLQIADCRPWNRIDPDAAHAGIGA